MLTRGDPATTGDDEAEGALRPGERALAAAIDMVWEGEEEVGRYLAAIRSRTVLRDARARCLNRFADRPANKGVLLRALALIDDALERFDGGPSRSDSATH